MIQLRLNAPAATEAVAAASEVPPGFVTLRERLQQSIDRKLGYHGHDRFVFFYYEPRGEEVVWNDGRSYGFASGGWCTFTLEVEPLAGQYGMNIGGSGHRADHVLLLDRRLRRAYFADRVAAEQFVANQQT